MTNKELLEKLADIAHNKDAHEARNNYLLALRAVVELHTPRSSGPFEFCFECNGWDEEDGTEYPCPTIQAIEKELK